MTARFPPLLAVACFLLFAAWSLVVPVYEAPDEPAHWQYARHLRDHWSLPLYRPGFEEANSPPLAYLLYAPFAVEIGSPEIAVGRRPNGDLVSLAGTRMFLNTDEDYGRYWPLRAGRLLSALMSVGTVVFTWRAGLAAGGREVGLLAALAVALLPMFAFRAGHVSNDALVACLAAAATWGMVRLVREPFSWRVAWLCSATVGLAYMSKISAIALVPPFVLALLLSSPAPGWRDRLVRLSALALAGAIVAPWSIRNVMLYGDPFASEAMRVAVAHIITDRALFSWYFVSYFPLVLAKSFVGVFGWMSLIMPGWVYAAYWSLFAIAGGTFVVALARKAVDRRLAAVLALSGLAVLVIVVRINLQFTQPQGRYLFPGLPAFAILLALGLHALAGSLRQAVSPLAIGGLLLAGNLYALFGVVWPGFHPAPLRTLASGERVMVPSLLTDLAVLDGSGHWIVTGATPQWLARVEAEADRFAALEVELTASMTPVAQRACVHFRSAAHSFETHPPVCVDWLADGRPHVVRVPLQTQPGWTGIVTHVRLNPVAAGTATAGTEVATRRPRLVPR
jgi:4-amino-4-deoxy-L-arabinose transferase-like glycosyltransferase